MSNEHPGYTQAAHHLRFVNLIQSHPVTNFKFTFYEHLEDINRFSIVFLCHLVIYSSSYSDCKVSLFLAEENAFRMFPMGSKRY